MTKVLAVSSSLRDRSHSRILLRVLLREVESAGGEVRLLDLREMPLPLFNPDHRAGDHLPAVTDLVEWADAFVLTSPDYHGALSGTIKNFLDYFWRDLAGKLFATIVASHEKGLTVQDQLRTTIRQCYGWSLPYGIGFNGDTQLDEAGLIKDEFLARRVRMMAYDVVLYGGLLRAQFINELARAPRRPGFAENFKRD